MNSEERKKVQMKASNTAIIFLIFPLLIILGCDSNISSMRNSAAFQDSAPPSQPVIMGWDFLDISSPLVSSLPPQVFKSTTERACFIYCVAGMFMIDNKSIMREIMGGGKSAKRALHRYSRFSSHMRALASHLGFHSTARLYSQERRQTESMLQDPISPAKFTNNRQEAQLRILTELRRYGMNQDVVRRIPRSNGSFEGFFRGIGTSISRDASRYARGME